MSRENSKLQQILSEFDEISVDAHQHSTNVYLNPMLHPPAAFFPNAFLSLEKIPLAIIQGAVLPVRSRLPTVE
jgi:hypothetical protein